ncbi:unnamed protein product [Malus baccata var. baccata]
MMKKCHTTSSSMQSVFDDVLLKILIIFKEIAEDRCIYPYIYIIDFEIVNLLRSRGTSNKV